MKFLFLEADDSVLVKRYKETRRSHPLAGGGRIDKGIGLERKKLAFLKRAGRLYHRYQPSAAKRVKGRA